MIAFLGTGLLGSNFVKALLKKGKQVQVWNRTMEKAVALEADGAKVFHEPADAVRGCTTIHLTLSDDAAVDEVLEKASFGFDRNAIIIDHTTTSAPGAVKRTAYWKEQGLTYIHAPVFMGPANAFESSGYMLISGDQEIIKKLTPELSSMTGRLINLGPEVNKAAGTKLIGNLFLLSLTAGLSDTFALAKSLGMSTGDVEALFNIWNPGSLVPARLKRMANASFIDPSWELKMARKDARLMMEQAQRGGSTFTVIPSIAKEMDRWIEKGHGNDDWTIIAKDNLP